MGSAGDFIEGDSRSNAADRWSAEYDFLLGSGLDAEELSAASRKAAELNVEPHDVLIADGMIKPQAYIEALGLHLGVAVLSDASSRTAAIVVDGTVLRPNLLAVMASDHLRHGNPIVLAVPLVIASIEGEDVAKLRLNRAVRGLRRIDPSLSAAGAIHLWQIIALAVAVGVVIGSGAVAPSTTRTALMLVVSFPFFVVVLFRIIVLLTVISGKQRSAGPLRDRLTEGELPQYAVLVPLFREAAVLPDLIEALSRLDYPTAKLDCILVLEASDLKTIAIARAMPLPPFMRIVVVPDCAPRTKPKALNYALQVARGELIAVYDAEDVPDPQQLRMAAQAFANGDPRIVCVQASLAIHNASETLITRQFALEYAALFEGLLPALARFRLPVPLGGTSNHFRRSFLEISGGWDPHNVTEDADLGIRIARSGGMIATIASVTWEEAPTRLKPWIGQRTRWLKGWMQTYGSRQTVKKYNNFNEVVKCYFRNVTQQGQKCNPKTLTNVTQAARGRSALAMYSARLVAAIGTN